VLSVAKISASGASGAAAYYGNLGREDYYAKGGEPPGQWTGKGAEKLGLSGHVGEADLMRAFQGYHPGTGDALVSNAGAEHAPGWDATFSAPKSVSTVWAVADTATRQSIQAAHAAAVREAVGYLESEAVFARRGHAGESREQTQGIIAAQFEHSTNRNQDPDLHTHVLVFNVAERQDGSMGGVDLDTRHKMAAGALYRVELAHQLKEMGFTIEKGKAGTFEIAGTPDQLTHEWSSRHDEIKAAMRESGATGYEASKHAAIETRERKGEVNRSELFEAWKGQSREHTFGAEQATLIREFRQDVEPEKRPEFDVGTVMEKATGQAATLTQAQLNTRTFVDCQGVMSASQAREAARQVAGHEKTVALEGGRYTTTDMLKTERIMLERAQAMSTNHFHRVDPAEIERFAESKALSPEQQRALAHITVESGQIAAVQGWAGTGKSYMLAAASDAWRYEGLHVRGAALSGKAAEGLEQSSGIKSQTIHSLLADIERGQQPLTMKTVLVVDEAGMIGTRQMAALVDRCRESGAKLVLVGDSKQLQPIDAGGAFRGVSQAVGYAEITDVRRQNLGADRDAARAMREGRAGDALQNYQARGLLAVEGTMAAARQQAAAGYVRDASAGKDSIILAGTRAEVRSINETARNLAREAGQVRGEDTQVSTSRGPRALTEGDRLVFLRNDADLHVKNGTLATVKSIDQDRLVVSVREPGGAREISLSTKDYNHIDHGYCLTTHKAQGVTVDRAHVVAGDMTGREWSYVAATRSREETRFYTSEDKMPQSTKVAESDLAKGMARSQEKDLASDYQEREAPATADKAPAPEHERGAQEPEGIGQDADKIPAPDREGQDSSGKVPAPDQEHAVADREGQDHEVQDTTGKAAEAGQERGDQDTAKTTAPEQEHADKGREGQETPTTPERESQDTARSTPPDQDRGSPDEWWDRDFAREHKQPDRDGPEMDR